MPFDCKREPVKMWRCPILKPEPTAGVGGAVGGGRTFVSQKPRKTITKHYPAWNGLVK
ncbi:inositol monophosphatase [Anopheles sinensis]|uniref:Inositol monophosphatase n=1 Tax=Anopheles sinensis TaxID=74873 RepID=A0A084WT48_ANOSI|nr:inositol monophosphatase [Anopheles sinensis]